MGCRIKFGRGIVALRCLRVSQRQEEIAQLRQSQKGQRGPIQPPGLVRLLLHKKSNILVEQEDDSHHAAQKQPMQNAVEQLRHGRQMVHRVHRSPVQRQVSQHHHQQQ